MKSTWWARSAWSAASQWVAMLCLSFGALAVSAIVAPVSAQGYFGQNQVQYDHLEWRVIETEHFLVHYYPAIEDVAPDAARMAERSYARLSRLMAHQFREKKPILVFGSSGDFAQSNVFGDLGEGTGGVTDPLRQRMAQFFTGDWGSFEHVLQHEMVHVFQFDIFSRGRAGSGLQNLAMVNPPLWFMEGLAEYFSIGDKHPWTDAWVRDAVVNGTLPSIQQMTERPDKYFPYRYGLSVWQYVGQRWGDEVIGEIMNAVPSLGIDRAFRREIGLNTDELSAEWKQAMQAKFLPIVATLDRPRSFAEPLLSQRRSGSIASLFVAPALSNDGKLITYIALGSLLRGEVFPDLYLANAETGKRIARLVKTTTNPDFEQLRFIYSQPSFSPDGKTLAFTGQRGGRDVLYLMDVKSRSVIKRMDFQLDQILSPSFSPDGRNIVFSGMKHGLSDLYIASIDSSSLRQITNDQYGDLQPQWSPDGKSIAFASDRGPDTDFEILKIGKWKISIYDIATGNVSILPGQASGTLNLNPQWAPDGQSIAYITDRTGIANLFLYDLSNREHYQLTNVSGAITAVAEYSPAITWARGGDVLAFVYYEKGEHAIWKVKNPRSLKKDPYREPVVVASLQGSPMGVSGVPQPPVASADPLAHLPRGNVRDTSAARQSVYRSPTAGARISSELPLATLSQMAEQVSVRTLMDSFDFNLPDTTRFTDGKYKVRLTPEYVAQPSIGYQQGGYGQGTYGGTTIVLSDLLGDHRLALSGSINGQLADATVFVGYTNLGRRLQYTTGILQQPVYLLSNATQTRVPGGTAGQYLQSQEINRLVIRQVFAAALYPLNRFTRWELGASFSNVDQQVFPYTREVDYDFGYATGYSRGPTRNVASANTVFTIPGLRNRQHALRIHGAHFWKARPVFKCRRVWEHGSTRNTPPTLAPTFRFCSTTSHSQLVSRRVWLWDAMNCASPKWLGRPDFIRGYNRDNLSSVTCTGLPNDDGTSCNTVETIGSRIAFANAELRFPIIRNFGLKLPVSLPPLDGLFFYDAGVAWSAGQEVSLSRGENYDFTQQRALLRSYGFGLRLNLFNIAVVRWDYAIPRGQTRPEGIWNLVLRRQLLTRSRATHGEWGARRRRPFGFLMSCRRLRENLSGPSGSVPKARGRNHFRFFRRKPLAAHYLGRYLTPVRTLIASALLLLACGGSDTPSPSPGAGANSGIKGGPDHVVLRASRGGGVISAYQYPALDSVLWKSRSRVPALDRVIAFGAEDGFLAAVDSSGAAVRVDLRSGSVSRLSGKDVLSMSSADASDIFILSSKGEIRRQDPIGGDWSFTPELPIDAIFAQRDGSLIAAGARNKRVVVWRVRPPGQEIVDTIALDLGGTDSALARAMTTTAGVIGDRVFFAGNTSVVEIRARDLVPVLQVKVGSPIAAIAATPSGDRLFVAPLDQPRLRVVDRFEEGVTGDIKLPAAASDLRMDPLGRLLLVHGSGDMVYVVSLATDKVLGSVTSAWRGDLPLVMPDGMLALAEGDDVTFVNSSSLREERRIKAGASDFWHTLTWNGFRPRAAGLDEPVRFRRSAPRETYEPDDSQSYRDSGSADGRISTDTAGGSAGSFAGSARGGLSDSLGSSAGRGTAPVAMSAQRGASTSRSRDSVFTVSFAALLDGNAATALARSIQVDGQIARVIAATRSGTTLYRVVLGPFPTRVLADRAGKVSGKSYWVFEGTP